MSTSPSEGSFVAIIADGNRRYEAQIVQREEGRIVLPTALEREVLERGYRGGAEAIKAVIECARDQAVGIFAAWGWSTKNMEQRPEHERQVVFGVVRDFLRHLEDDWMKRPENQDVRLVHMGRTDRIGKVDKLLWEDIQRVSDSTRERAGMVVALCLDYSGPDELDRALELWRASGCNGDWKQFLDLPRQGIPYKPLDLRIRTGETDPLLKHANAYLLPYTLSQETRDVYVPEHLPQYTPAMFLQHLQALENSEKRKGR